MSDQKPGNYKNANHAEPRRLALPSDDTVKASGTDIQAEHKANVSGITRGSLPFGEPVTYSGPPFSWFFDLLG